MMQVSNVTSEGVSSPYEPLLSSQSIRLVEIHPAAEPVAPMICSLVPTSLDDMPSYEAISYTWGDTADPQSITLNSTQMSVTQHCHSMLRRIRNPTQPRVVWIDAICINQTDIQERNAQVAIMGKIYRRAACVIIDIGEARDNSDFAMTAMLEHSPTRVYHSSEVWRVFNSVSAIYWRPWFDRIWVLQEVFMAQKAIVLCGEKTVPWEVFMGLRLNRLLTHPERQGQERYLVAPNTLPTPMSIGTRAQRNYLAKDDLLSLLCTGRTCQATDPSDKVIALIPLLEDAAETGLRIEYGTTESVYTDVASWIVRHIGVSFLSCVTDRPPNYPLPSWVPDWSAKSNESWMFGLSGIFNCEQASGGTEAKAEVIDGSVLKVRGIHVDTIRTATGDLDLLDAFKIKNNRRHNQIPGFFDEFERHRNSLGKTVVELPKDSNIPLPQSWLLDYEGGRPFSDYDYIQKMLLFCKGRQLITTSKGYIGITSHRARVGDMVCVFLGAVMPFILTDVLDEGDRDKGDEGQVRRQYNLVGEAYVWGLLEGEALSGLNFTTARNDTAEGPLHDFHIY